MRSLTRAEILKSFSLDDAMLDYFIRSKIIKPNRLGRFDPMQVARDVFAFCFPICADLASAEARIEQFESRRKHVQERLKGMISETAQIEKLLTAAESDMCRFRAKTDLTSERDSLFGSVDTTNAVSGSEHCDVVPLRLRYKH
jgi:hypothetical protein